MQRALAPWPTRSIVSLFWIAAGGIGWHHLLFPTTNLTGSVAIAIALILICIDQGRMTWVDLDNIYQVSLADHRVVRFYGITLSTIIIELIGFYLVWHHLALGMVIFIISQLFFNTAANVQLYPHSHAPIRPFPMQARWPVLLANGVALSLITLWQTNHLRQLTSSIWLGMVVIYLTVKYLMAADTDTDTMADESESP
ncbi:hypothetical protein IQ260_27570 [Leptolyngbya cf. ectocarpi LEGE 11479]|uniref:Uncharacterized protein n=1 Tax=Leptolyngbya cf. ectocarpi LEGE 11479 TaxID=1828722 RepID=A0A928ZZP6_LEPEC|nr:hypothetical protein [Leptolyngbya ectocarpi]MBE9070407.1 hypothetical protein [Leptolyngbya cf. ectocarpi LEGE 11479]